MPPSEKHIHSEKYLTLCQHPAVQALKPATENIEGLWLPTTEQLHELLNQKLPYPERSNFQETKDGWEYETYFHEWAADYGTYIDAYRQFIGPDPDLVLLQVLVALLGIEGRWMV